MNGTPRIEITEQPARLLRFRYEREGRTGGLIVGVSTTPSTRTHPTLKIENWAGSALIVVSCVTKDPPYRPHPHKLVGNESCHRGVCRLTVPDCTKPVEFSGLGIHCTKRRDIAESMRTRQEMKIDPYKTGFQHANETIDLTAVRLCFQVLLKQQGRYVPLHPVVSEPIYDKRVYCNLNIVKLSKCTSPADGGTEDIILVCDKVAKDDIEIRFFEERNGQVVWEGFGQFNPTDVHKQVVIWFKPPPYRNLEIVEPVRVFIELRRKSDRESSRPLPFEYSPSQNQLRRRNRAHYQRILSDPLYDQYSVPATSPQPRRVSSSNVPNIPSSFIYAPSEPARQILDISIPSTSREFPIVHLGPRNDNEDSLPSTLDFYNTHVDLAAPVDLKPENTELNYPETGNSNAGMDTYPEGFTESHIIPGAITAHTFFQNIVPEEGAQVASTSEMEFEVPSGLSGLIDAGENLHEINLNSGELDRMSS